MLASQEHQAEQVAPVRGRVPPLAGRLHARAARRGAAGCRGARARDADARGQLWHWIYFHGVRDFDRMLNVSKTLRQKLADSYTLERPQVVTEQVSSDGTRKWLIRMPPAPGDRLVGGRTMGAEIECVYIPESDRGTLCVSSPGRLHAHLLVLPHRHAEARAQPEFAGDRPASSSWRATCSAISQG